MSENSSQVEEKIIEINNLGEIKKLGIAKEEKRLTKLEILRKISSGTALREGLNHIVNSSKGALILVNNESIANIFQGGFKVNCRFTPERLAELAKMDGAIILSEDFKKILFANTLLIPNSNLNTSETGTRHQAAERTAKQIGGIVIAVSERKKQITIYYGKSRYVLQHTEDLLRRATETLQILEKQREIFNELLINLNVLEITNLVSVGDVCKALQRIEMVKKMAEIINEYIIELGKDGVIVRMRMRELVKGIDKIQAIMFKDYNLRQSKVSSFFDNLNFEELLDLENIAGFLFKEALDTLISPCGYRILSKIELNKDKLDNLIRSFKNLEEILNTDEKTLKKVLKEDVDDFKKDLVNLREQIMVGKKI